MTDEKKYRTEVPNIIDDLGLDPYERTLYVHYKRVCGADGGQCTEGVRGTAERTKISKAKVASVRAQLVKRGLILVQPFGEVGGVAVTVVDIWPLNHTYYATKDRPNVSGWTIEELTHWVRGVHQVDTPQEEAPSQEPISGQGCPPQGQGCPSGGQKKKPIKNKSSKDDSGQKPPEVGPKTLVKEVFLKSSKLPWPGLKPKQKFWWSQFGEIVKIFDNDPDKAVRAVNSVIEYMHNRNLSIVGPQSVVDLCRQVAGGQPLSNGRGLTEPNTSGLKVQGSAKEGYSF